MKQIKIFERKVPMLAVIMAVLIIGLASAALITNFATHTTTVNVSTPIVIDSHNYTLDLYSGENNTDDPISINVTNHANVPTYVGIETTINSTYGNEDNGAGGICVSYKYNTTMVTNITIPANDTSMGANNTVELMMYINTAPGLAPANYTIVTNFTPLNVSCVSL
ncbi:hypothetical protein KAU33_04330 [Candidatus Dependentiae bacterium]|nr:hypothetical protein [Candidatus Dependentiae bacterium]